jgi:hypothetical protein
MKRAASALILISTLLPLALAGGHAVRVASANFYAKATTPPPQGTIPPEITIANSENQNVIELVVKIAPVICPTKYSMLSLPELYYKCDWMTNESFGGYVDTLTLPLTGAPIGTHIIIVRVEQGCFYGNEDGVPYYFRINVSLVVKFTVENRQPFSAKILATFNLDPTIPAVSALSLENKTFVSPTVPLGFAVSDLVTQISYSLDGQDNVTIAGNTTLRGLSNGEHCITVYYADIVGNVGASENAHFYVNVPFPISLVVAVYGVSLATVGLALLVYFKKHKR